MSEVTSTKHEVDEDLLKPLWIARIIAKRPCLVYWVTFIVIILMAIACSGVFTLDLEGTGREWLVEDDEYSENYDAWTLAQEEKGDAGDDTGSNYTANPQTEVQGLWNVFMLFEMEDYDSDSNNWILTPSNMETIIEYENKVIENDRWKNYYCLVEDTTFYECSYFSVAQDVYAAFNYSFDDMTTDAIRAWVWNEYKTNYYGWGIYAESSFNTEFTENNKTKYYRSFLYSAGPIPDNITNVNYTDGNDTITYVIKNSEYPNTEDEDDYDEQEDIYNEDFAFDIWEEITVDHDAYLIKNDLRIACLIYSAWVEYIWTLFYSSVTYVFFAMLSVLIWMTIHLQSFWLSCLGITGIMLSFPFAYFIYYFIYGISHFDFLSSLIIFVLLGVGADDVFVFTDAWHQSIHFVKDPNSDEERMTFTYRRAAKAMFVTQITTFFAFLATAISTLLPISAFGYWASLIVATDYIIVITMYPAVLMMYHKYIAQGEKAYCCCCCHGGCPGGWWKCCKCCTCCKCCAEPAKRDMAQSKSEMRHPEKVNNASSDVPPSQELELGNVQTASVNTDNGTTPVPDGKGESLVPPGSTNTKGTADNGDGDDDGPPPGLTRARSVEEQAEEYRGIEKFCGVKWASIIIKIKYYVLACFAVIMAVALYLMITGLEPLEESEGIFTEDHYMQQILNFANEFGVSEEDGLLDVTVVWGVDGVDRSGTNYWDTEDYGKIVWDDDFDMSSYDAQLFMYYVCNNLSETDIVYSRDSVECPLNDLVNYTKSLNDSSDLTFPWTYMDPDDSGYDADVQKAQFAEYLYNFSVSGYAGDGWYNVWIQTPDESDDGNYYIKYFSVFAYIDLTFAASRSESVERRDTWVEWMDETFYDSSECDAIGTVCKPFQVSSTWTWLVSQDALVQSAVQGVAIALPIAFVVLIFSTRNWIMAIFATLDIVGVMACGLSVISIAGWQFGTTESVSIVLIIGFSVDYVVHLANAYLECKATSREERLSFSLLTMGVSVGSGAVTTFLAGIFLLFPSFLFFYKMGVMLLFTIIWSIFWAMFFFTSLLAAIGPEGDTGRIPFEEWFQKCKDSTKQATRKESD